MMNYNYMMGTDGGIMMFLGWVIYILVAVLLVLAIIALLKYINKK